MGPPSQIEWQQTMIKVVMVDGDGSMDEKVGKDIVVCGMCVR